MKVVKSDPIEIPMLTDDRFDRIEQFAELVKPVQQFMLKHYNPHSKVIIECNGATITTDEMFIPLKVGEQMGYVACLFIGGIVGYFTAALMVAAKEGDKYGRQKSKV